MVPLRFISENLDSIVDWDAASQTITIKGDGKERYVSTRYFDGGIFQGEVILVNGEELLDDQGRYVFSNGRVQQGRFEYDKFLGR